MQFDPHDFSTSRLARDSVEQTQSFPAELRQRLAEMESILTITGALVSEMSLARLLEVIVTQAEHLANAEGAALFLLRRDGQRLEVAVPGDTGLQIKHGIELPIHGSLTQLALTSRQVQISNRVQDDGRTAFARTLLQPARPRSMLYAPLTGRQKILGVLLVWNKRTKGFNADDCHLMALFADQAALALQNAWLHERHRRLTITQERRKLARHLHDSVTQSLYSIALAAQSSLRHLHQIQADDGLRSPITHILKLAQSALTEMREQLHAMHPTTLTNHGLVEVLTEHCNMLRARYPLVIEFTASLDTPLTIWSQEALYNIAREALWNVVRHAGARCVDISLVRKEDQVELCIVDDGVGFDPSTDVRGETIGLRSIEEYALTLGGTFELQSAPGQGAKITVSFPAP